MQPSWKVNAMFKPDLLRSFIAVIDARSFTTAARQLNSTQSTISQKIMRLEEAAGVLLIDRASSGIVPTEAGERMIGYARRILALNDEASAVLAGSARDVTLRLGLPEDFASGPVTQALAGFVRRHPRARLEVTSGLSRDLYRLFRQGDLDLVLVKQPLGEVSGIMHWPEPLAWFQGATQRLHENETLPLVAFPTGGLYRHQMTAALDTMGRRWRIVYTSSSLAGVLSAIDAGLGVSLLPRRAVGPGLLEVSSLPNVEAMEIAIHQADPDMPYLTEIVGLLAEVVTV